LNFSKKWANPGEEEILYGSQSVKRDVLLLLFYVC